MVLPTFPGLDGRGGGGVPTFSGLDGVGRGTYLPRCGHGGGGGGTYLPGYPPPEQLSVCLLPGGRYAYSVHAGGLSCMYYVLI